MNRTFCDFCDELIDDVTENAAREGGRIGGTTVRHGKQITYSLSVSAKESWDICRRCAIEAFLVAEGAMAGVSNESESGEGQS